MSGFKQGSTDLDSIFYQFNNVFTYNSSGNDYSNTTDTGYKTGSNDLRTRYVKSYGNASKAADTGFKNGSTDIANYFQPAGVIPAYQFPPSNFSASYTQVISGLSYGNGTYTLSASTERNGTGTCAYAFNTDGSFWQLNTQNPTTVTLSVYDFNQSKTVQYQCDYVKIAFPGWLNTNNITSYCITTSYINNPYTWVLAYYDAGGSLYQLDSQSQQLGQNVTYFFPTYKNNALSPGLYFLYRGSDGGYPTLTGLKINYKIKFLDVAPPSGMIFCYSVRLVVASYTGPIMRVNRTSDNAQDDFYSDTMQTYLTNGSGISMDTWLNGSGAKVMNIYDQTGNGNTLNKQTAGSLVKVNGKYILLSSNANKTWYQMSTSSAPTNFGLLFQFSDTGGIGNIHTIFSAWRDHSIRLVPYDSSNPTTTSNTLYGSNGPTYGNDDFLYANSQNSGTTVTTLVNNVSTATVTFSPNSSPVFNSCSVSISNALWRLSDGHYITLEHLFYGPANPTRSMDGYFTEMIGYNTTLDNSVSDVWYSRCKLV